MTIRTLVVDDSPAMRAMLTRALASEEGIEVVAAASDPHEARALIKETSPDVMTLDVEMPGMNGLDFLEKVMRLRPMPVVMCSTLTQRGAAATIEALRLGAVACFAKPADPSALRTMGSTLAGLLREAAATRVRALAPPTVLPATAGRLDRLVAIGASTGGVEALFRLLSAWPADGPPTVVVQHMPRSFTGSFADRLNRQLAPNVVEATDGLKLRPGLVAIAPGGDRHMTIVGDYPGTVRLRAGEARSGHRPSVDILFQSVAAIGGRAVGVILTGMGSDGAQGLLAMRRAGARTLGQDEASSVVYGMPRAARELGAVERELPLEHIAAALFEAASNERRH